MFESFVGDLEREKCTDDELSREEREEDVPAGAVRLRIGEKLVGGSGSGSNGYHEVVGEGDEFVI